MRLVDMADYRLSALVHMNMLDPHDLRSAIPQTTQGLYLKCVGAYQRAFWPRTGVLYVGS